MGTNYYMLNGKPPCKECGRPFEDERHIGKSSAGWVFALHVYPEEGINNLLDWLVLIAKEGTRIRDEYGHTVSVEDLLRTIVGRRGKEEFRPSWLAQNQAVPGPHGLARSRIDGHHTIGHGEGTWDYHIGDFS